MKWEDINNKIVEVGDGENVVILIRDEDMNDLQQEGSMDHEMGWKKYANWITWTEFASLYAKWRQQPSYCIPLSTTDDNFKRLHYYEWSNLQCLPDTKLTDSSDVMIDAEQQSKD